ncbi:MAG: alpha/beta hydrolase [Arthrospira sp. PLM2.Bin9]|nr:alpha/beta hydrolase [Arthrospira sp. PLM2.Bin9]TVU54654.1 MAG: alpha/beta hydrolase [Arthrospira sp. PLM2.Bin9]
MNKAKIKKWVFGDFSLRRIVTSILAIYIIVGVWAYFKSDRLIFLPRPPSYEKTEDLTFLTTLDGVPIAALYLPNPTAQYTILYSHGNAEDLGDIRPRLESLRDIGFSVFAYDYPGYGLSGGTPSVAGAYQAIEAAYYYLTQVLQVPPERIIVYGRSVGSGPSTHLAARKLVGGLVIESGFISTFRVVTRIPIFPFDRFPNLANLQNVEVPVLIIHGDRDRVIPFDHGQRLYDDFDGPKMSLWVEGAGHNDLLEVAGDRYVETLLKFTEMLSKKSDD